MVWFRFIYRAYVISAINQFNWRINLIFPFIPNSASIPTTFQPTLDGSVYQANLWWNVAAQRVYITLNNQSNNAIFTMPLIESPLNYPISLTTGYFTSTMVYYPDSGLIEVLP